MAFVPIHPLPLFAIRAKQYAILDFARSHEEEVRSEGVPLERVAGFGGQVWRVPAKLNANPKQPSDTNLATAGPGPEEETGLRFEGDQTSLLRPEPGARYSSIYSALRQLLFGVLKERLDWIQSATVDQTTYLDSMKLDIGAARRFWMRFDLYTSDRALGVIQKSNFEWPHWLAELAHPAPNPPILGRLIARLISLMSRRILQRIGDPSNRAYARLHSLQRWPPPRLNIEIDLPEFLDQLEQYLADLFQPDGEWMRDGRIPEQLRSWIYAFANGALELNPQRVMVGPEPLPRSDPVKKSFNASPDGANFYSFAEYCLQSAQFGSSRASGWKQLAREFVAAELIFNRRILRHTHERTREGIGATLANGSRVPVLQRDAVFEAISALPDDPSLDELWEQHETCVHAAMHEDELAS